MREPHHPPATAELPVTHPRPAAAAAGPTPARGRHWTGFAALLGAYLTVHGYQAYEVDQAYRLPILLHRQNPALFATDPFVRAFDTFNPHRGYLALLDLGSRIVGLDAALALIYAGMFALACWGIDRLARAAWPESGERVGLVAMGLVLLARAGNIGTNHLFESMLLDRGIGFALGWVALGAVLARPERGRGRVVSAAAIGLAAVVHPAVGLQLGMMLAGAWVAWAVAESQTAVTVRTAAAAVAALALALVPSLWLYAGQRSRLFEGLPPEQFRLLSAFVQSPQHMVPHLWRLPQWLAWACFPVLAVVSLCGRPAAGWSAARVRLAVLLGVGLAGLALAWVAIDVLLDVRVTVFQPFRMATIVRGLALVAVAGRVRDLWVAGGLARGRAALLAVGLTGDWSLVVATAVELAAVIGGTLVRARAGSAVSAAPARRPGLDWSALLAAAALAAGLVFLARHDTESGHWRLLGALGGAALLERLDARRRRRSVLAGPHARADRVAEGDRSRPLRIPWPGTAAVGLAAAWAVPACAAVASTLVSTGHARPAGLALGLIRHARFAEVPTTDVERLALWCRLHTPPSARFVGPPGPKTFRLWSRRSLAFNRASGPYHAAELADWADRFRAHVRFAGTTEQFARAYLRDRQGLERRYLESSHAELAELARSQGATHVIAAPPGSGVRAGDPLELLHVEGRYAVYRVRAAALASAQPPGEK